MSQRRTCRLGLAGLTLALLALQAEAAHANGRMPGGNDVVFHPSAADQLLLRATFGLLRTRDAGASWAWICEQAIDISGVIADPPAGMSADGSLVLLPPTGSALISHDQGCSWRREPAQQDEQGVDLTAHPSDPRQLFTLFSTVVAVDAGIGVFENKIMRTRDDAQSWELVASLPSDFEAETLELAKSDPQRIYVSGTDSADPRLGVLFVSEDGGAHFEKRTLALPAGTGSLLISAIHPHNPDMLWLRVPARGDTIGLLPARLYLSTDKGQSFRQLAGTQRGMFGFALSPDGATLAYGGPADGLYVGASDGASGFQKRGNWSIRCLRWSERGALYACGSEPLDPFSLGVSDDQGVTFRALYRLADTCPAACAEGTQFEAACQSAWPPVQRSIAAPGLSCSVPWSVAAPADAGADAEVDAGLATPSQAEDASAPLDAGDTPESVDAGEDEADEEEADSGDAGARAREGGSGCGCGVQRGAGASESVLSWLAVVGLLARGRLRRR
jgi:hypothetical protein